MPAPRLTDVAGAAEYLGISVAALRKKVDRGQVPVVRIDGRLRFDLNRLAKLIDARTIEVTA